MNLEGLRAQLVALRQKLEQLPDISLLTDQMVELLVEQTELKSKLQAHLTKGGYPGGGKQMVLDWDRLEHVTQRVDELSNSINDAQELALNIIALVCEIEERERQALFAGTLIIPTSTIEA